MVCRSLTHMSWDTAKAVDWKSSVVVVGLYNFPNIHYCCLVLILRTHKVKTSWLGVVTIAPSVVNRSDQ